MILLVGNDSLLFRCLVRDLLNFFLVGNGSLQFRCLVRNVLNFFIPSFTKPSRSMLKIEEDNSSDDGADRSKNKT